MHSGIKCWQRVENEDLQEPVTKNRLSRGCRAYGLGKRERSPFCTGRACAAFPDSWPSRFNHWSLDSTFLHMQTAQALCPSSWVSASMKPPAAILLLQMKHRHLGKKCFALPENEGVILCLGGWMRWKPPSPQCAGTDPYHRSQSATDIVNLMFPFPRRRVCSAASLSPCVPNEPFPH